MNHHGSTVEACVAVLTVSDSRTVEDDRSGDAIIESLADSQHQFVTREVVRDEVDQIARAVTRWAQSQDVNTIIVSGGSGSAPRDVTPEAITPLLNARLPGFGELFRQLSYEEIGSAAMLSRADAGWIDEGSMRTAVFMLPGSPNAVQLAMRALILPQLGHLLAVCRDRNTI